MFPHILKLEILALLKIHFKPNQLGKESNSDSGWSTERLLIAIIRERTLQDILCFSEKSVLFCPV